MHNRLTLHRLQEQIDGIAKPWYVPAPTSDIYGYREALRAESMDCQRTYAQGLCRLFCQQFYTKLPRELRNMVYDIMHSSDEGERKWVSPATDENLRFYGPQIVRELAESYYRSKHLFLSSDTPEHRIKQFNTDITGLVPALFVRKVLFRVDSFAFLWPSQEESRSLLRTLERLQPMKRGTEVVFDVSNVRYNRVRSLNAGVKHFAPTLETLRRAGLKIEIHFAVYGLYLSTHSGICMVDNGLWLQDFVAQTRKVR